MIIHILEHGSPLCRFTDAAPADWPEGHRWTARATKDHATCEACLSAANSSSGPWSGSSRSGWSYSFEPSDRLRAIAASMRQRDLIRGPGDDRVAEALDVIADVIQAFALSQIRR